MVRNSTTRGTQRAAAGTNNMSTETPSSQRRSRPRAVTMASPAMEVTTTVSGTATTTSSSEFSSSRASGMNPGTAE